MEKRRALDETEKNLTLSAIKKLEERNRRISPKIKYYDYMLSEGLEVNKQDQYDKFLSIKKEINEEITLNNQKIAKLKDQLENGVEQKSSNDKIEVCNRCGQELKNDSED